MAQGIRAWTVAIVARANVILAVALYLALAFGVVQIWSILSHQGDAFAGSVLRINDDKK